MRKNKETLLAREIRFLGKTQKEFAEMVGANKDTVSKWVTGKVAISPQFFSKLQDYGIPIKALKDPSKEV